MKSLSHLCPLPFSVPGDITIGIENEWQVCVSGQSENIDLVQTILSSHHYRNLCDRTRSGDIPETSLHDLERWLHDNPEQIWENSWIRLPLQRLAPAVKEVFQRDLRRHRRIPDSPLRTDAARFMVEVEEESCIRIPVSYLLKLALLQLVAARRTPEIVGAYAHQIAGCFINDNTSPEISSFYPSAYQDGGRPGEPATKETMRRYLLTQWLTAYANQHMGLEQSGQHVLVYASPHPPIRQRALNAMIPDSFYRELFMSPCLSGWEDGEAKFQYMQLCHHTLARSQINAVQKMKEAGIIQNNLVVLPSLSHTGLSNNGIHISTGSRSLSRATLSPASDFGSAEEKYYGDLATKIIEHFLPLFVGTYSAAPWKFDFSDFHPEKILGFLPHELSATHLRMLWRRWKKKGRFKILGRSITPFGPVWLDRGISRLLGFKGDFVPDFRLLDYPIALSSTSQSPGLNGKLGNQKRLLHDLAEAGVFDTNMSLYRLWALRETAKMGFSGFEARFYSLMPDTLRDLPHAITLQALLSAYAYQAIASGGISHSDIPDTVHTESERRNVFFTTAVGLPTFYVKRGNRAQFMQTLIEKTPRIRSSRRYPGYWRVEIPAYRAMLIEHLREQASGCISQLEAGPTLDDLEQRLQSESIHSAAGRITSAIRQRIGTRSIPCCSAEVCNRATEEYYRTVLRREELERALDLLEADIAALEASSDPVVQETRRHLFPNRLPSQLLPVMRVAFTRERMTKHAWHKWIHLLLFIIRQESERAAEVSGSNRGERPQPEMGQHI